MKLMNGVLALGLVLGLSGFVRADGVHKMNVSILSDTSLNGTAIPAGNYKITWTEDNAAASVTLTRNGKVVAEAKGKVVEAKSPAAYSAIVSRKDGKGVDSIAEIQQQGTKTILVLSES
jgi:hypothetical protein